MLWGPFLESKGACVQFQLKAIKIQVTVDINMSEEQGDTGDPIANNSTTHLFGTLSDQQPEKPVPREQFVSVLD